MSFELPWFSAKSAHEKSGRIAQTAVVLSLIALLMAFATVHWCTRVLAEQQKSKRDVEALRAQVQQMRLEIDSLSRKLRDPRTQLRQAVPTPKPPSKTPPAPAPSNPLNVPPVKQ